MCLLWDLHCRPIYCAAWICFTWVKGLKIWLINNCYLIKGNKLMRMKGKILCFVQSFELQLLNTSQTLCGLHTHKFSLKMFRPKSCFARVIFLEHGSPLSKPKYFGYTLCLNFHKKSSLFKQCYNVCRGQSVTVLFLLGHWVHPKHSGLLCEDCVASKYSLMFI